LGRENPAGRWQYVVNGYGKECPKRKKETKIDVKTLLLGRKGVRTYYITEETRE